MADTAVKIGDISSQLTKASRLVLSTDGFWIQTGGDSQGNGQSVLIPAEFVRAYLTNGISPSIGEDGNWYINGKNLGVKAEGVTPQLRGGTLGIEVSYDKGQTWKTAVLYSDMDIDLDELEKQYKTAIDKANKATKNANDTGDHPTYIGKDNYVYKWNKTSKTYDKTDIFVKGDEGKKGDKGDTGATGGALWPHFKKVNNHLYAVDNGSNLGQRIKRINNHIVAIL